MEKFIAFKCFGMRGMKLYQQKPVHCTGYSILEQVCMEQNI